MSAQDHPERTRSRLGAGAVVVIVLVALAVTVAVGMVRSAGAPEVLAANPTLETEEVSAADLFVHVSGAVADPGLYRLAAGARVFDAVAAAGGLVEGADAEAVNLARPVTDGEQVRVPLVGETPAAAEGTRADGRVDLNTADAAALDELPRIGPAIAERIIAWREANGGFTSVDDLLAVPGIGEKMLASLRDLVIV
ncbi:ComEA family DNA-binding protein [Microbacterium caowuchunii]|uniref:ComEA family DNA-binding protein n=1 Tax=Microbacterium caowuchunii TaxID=2614638 RepID=UPI001243B357|nr:ComEA family DNA-binding protein [Microbacterium caowuchunii]QEW00145.1 ComEA family DNA-binding protein [Microbacterium caowuchunii]